MDLLGCDNDAFIAVLQGSAQVRVGQFGKRSTGLQGGRAGGLCRSGAALGRDGNELHRCLGGWKGPPRSQTISNGQRGRAWRKAWP